MKTRGAPPAEDQRFQRILGSYDSGRRGPMIVVVAGIHGNEPGGVQAVRRVLSALERAQLPLRGELLALAGNLKALQRSERYVARDLNRQWQAERVDELRAQDEAQDCPEDAEQRDLLRIFDRCVSEAAGPVVFFDLHSSSSDGPPFCCLGDTLPNRDIALALEVPVILGLEETIDGAVLEYFSARGLPGVAIEGGQHDAPHTVDRLEAALWLGLVATGALPEAEVPDAAGKRQVLRDAARGIPPVVELREHHRVTPEDDFVMEPGFRSFKPVTKGDVLARDRSGPVTAVESGRVLLPLYQGKGEDGFFLSRDVRPFWLSVARWVRRCRLGVILPLLPGVRRHQGRRDGLVVDPRVARWLVRELFHLLGYRRCRSSGAKAVFMRRHVADVTRQLPWSGDGQ